MGLIDQVYEIKKGDAESYRRVLKNLQKEQIDHLFAPHESWRSVFFCRKITAAQKISFQKFARSLFFDRLIKKAIDLPDSLRQLSLLTPFDQDLAAKLKDYEKNGRPYTLSPEGHLSAPPGWASMNGQEKLLQDSKTYEALLHRLSLADKNFQRSILIFPGSVWATKRWTEEGFIQAGQDLQKKGYPIVIMGGPGEEALCKSIAQQIPQAIDLSGRTSLYESALLISHAALVIGNDSASSHLASVAGTPLLAVFGPTILEFGYRPWSAQAFILQDNELRCRPCGKHGHQKCPLGTHACMKNIAAREVVKKAELILR